MTRGPRSTLVKRTGVVRQVVLKGLAVLILFGFFAGWLLVVGSVIELRGQRAVREWSASRGVITQSYARNARTFQNRKSWQVEIAGNYLDSGGRFGVGRVGYGVQYSVLTRGRAERMASAYPVGTELVVYHHPDRPGSAVLVRETSAAPTWRTLWVGLTLGLLPAGLYVAGRLRPQQVAHVG